MPELEIHHESEHEIDPAGRRVGVLAAMLAVALAVVTIASHRTHTSAIIHKSTANDAWSHYQSARVKYHNVELGEGLVSMFGAKGVDGGRMLAGFAEEKKKYDQEGMAIQKEAQGAEALAHADEHRALRYDLGEGLIEIGLVLSSLYFISRKKMFPALAVVSGAAGAAVALTGLVV